MAKKKIFISFDWDNDKRYKFLLSAWDASGDFDFSFSDQTSTEIDSDSIPVVKAGLTRKINQATCTIVIVGAHANTRHADHAEIGYKNWLNFEVAKSKANGNRLVAVKLDNSNTAPDELYNSGAAWASSFTEAAINAAIAKAYE